VELYTRELRVFDSVQRDWIVAWFALPPFLLQPASFVASPITLLPDQEVLMLPVIDRTSWRSPNITRDKFGRPVLRSKIDSITLHTGEGTKQSDLSWLTSIASEVSAHYYVDRAGNIYELVSPQHIAHHAGKCWYWARWFWRRDWNTSSIGIETEHKAGQDWPAIQVVRLAQLCWWLSQTYKIPPSIVVAHKWIAWPRGRKADPTDWPDMKLKSFIGDLGAVKLYRINLDVLPSARVRAVADVGSAHIASLKPGTVVAGRMIEGKPYNGVSQWLDLLPVPGCVWGGLVGQVA
jgi:hypothetical protein